MEIHGHRAVPKADCSALGPLSKISITFKTPGLPFRVAMILMKFLDLIMVDITLNIYNLFIIKNALSFAYFYLFYRIGDVPLDSKH